MRQNKNRVTSGHFQKKASTDSARQRSALIAALAGLGYYLFVLLYLELILHILVFGAPDQDFIWTIGFSFVFACALAFFTSFLPKAIHFGANLILTIFLILLYGSQMVYYFVFGTLYSVAQMQMGGAAVTSFWQETLLAMKDHLPWVLAVFVPLLVLILLRIFCKRAFAPSNAAWKIVLIVVAVQVQLLAILCLQIGETGYFSNYYFYYSDSATADQAADRFGLLTAFRLDMMGAKESQQEDPGYYIPQATAAPTEVVESTTPPGETIPQEQETVPETEPPREPEYNIFSIDFDMLNGMTKDEKLRAINNYCASLPGTQKNKYTGMLSEYNLVVVCAESFSAAAIHPEATPTLYRMANEGILFKNFYNTFPNNTIDGEYALCMGLYPDTSRNKNESSFLASRFTYLPFCLGNAFQEQRGVQSHGYHNNNRDYYSRGASHYKMGYEMQFSGSGMTFTSSAWPKSDLEMLEQSVDDYITQDQFNAYYMTFSGHMRYDVNTNGMALKNWDTVAGLNYSEEARCYLSCHVELDNAMKYLMDRLEAEGIADKTAIVLVGDHFPYGLTDEQYSELIGYTIDDFSKYKSSLLFWVGGIEENIVVEKYCCNVDILPTILNLWGFDYDSRMLAGTDVFSDGEHMAVLIDKSFYTDKVWLNASTGEIRYLVDEQELPANYVENLIKTVETKFSISADMLNKTYYKFVFKEGSAAVSSQDPADETTPD